MQYSGLAHDDHRFLGKDYCSGYTDIYGKWNNGFYCPPPNPIVQVFCCGTTHYKYCCISRGNDDLLLLEQETKTNLSLEGGGGDQSTSPEDNIRVPVTLAIFCAIVGTISLIVTGICFFHSCWTKYNKKRGHQGIYSLHDGPLPTHNNYCNSRELTSFISPPLNNNNHQWNNNGRESCYYDNNPSLSSSSGYYSSHLSSPSGPSPLNNNPNIMNANNYQPNRNMPNGHNLGGGRTVARCDNNVGGGRSNYDVNNISTLFYNNNIQQQRTRQGYPPSYPVSGGGEASTLMTFPQLRDNRERESGLANNGRPYCNVNRSPPSNLDRAAFQALLNLYLRLINSNHNSNYPHCPSSNSSTRGHNRQSQSQLLQSTPLTSTSNQTSIMVPSPPPSSTQSTHSSTDVNPLSALNLIFFLILNQRQSESGERPATQKTFTTTSTSTTTEPSSMAGAVASDNQNQKPQDINTTGESGNVSNLPPSTCSSTTLDSNIISVITSSSTSTSSLSSSSGYASSVCSSVCTTDSGCGEKALVSEKERNAITTEAEGSANKSAVMLNTTEAGNHCHHPSSISSPPTLAGESGEKV